METEQVGTVIVFSPGVTEEQVRKALSHLALDVDVQSVQVRKFNPEYGSPVWYVP